MPAFPIFNAYVSVRIRAKFLQQVAAHVRN